MGSLEKRIKIGNFIKESLRVGLLAGGLAFLGCDECKYEPGWFSQCQSTSCCKYEVDNCIEHHEEEFHSRICSEVDNHVLKCNQESSPCIEEILRKCYQEPEENEFPTCIDIRIGVGNINSLNEEIGHHYPPVIGGIKIKLLRSYDGGYFEEIEESSSDEFKDVLTRHDNKRGKSMFMAEIYKTVETLLFSGYNGDSCYGEREINPRYRIKLEDGSCKIHRLICWESYLKCEFLYDITPSFEVEPKERNYEIKIEVDRVFWKSLGEEVFWM